MVSDQKTVFTVQNSNGVWTITNGSHTLDFNVNGVGNGNGSFVNNSTDFWGPSVGGNYNIYLYSKNVELSDEHLDIDGYSKLNVDSELTNGEYVFTTSKEAGKFCILSATDTDNTNIGTRDDTGHLQNQDAALTGSVLSLTKNADGTVYLSTMQGDVNYYLTIKNGKLFSSDLPQALTMEKQENGSYTIANTQGQKLSLEQEHFQAGSGATAVSLYKKDVQIQLLQNKVKLEKGFVTYLQTSAEPSWYYTDSMGVHAPKLQWNLSNGQGTVELTGNKLKAIAEQGSTTATAEIVYTDNYKQPIDGSVEIVVALAKTNMKGTTTEQPFQSTRNAPDQATANSQMFRIPAMITLNEGGMLAAADARWNSTMDAASNLDGLVSYSKDNGATWDWELVNHFVDYSNNTPGAPKQSASFIAPALI